MMTMSSKYADEYFGSLNSMCKGITKQKIAFSSLLGNQWESLTLSDQDALLDEHFVAPHIKQKYLQAEEDDKSTNNCDLPDFFPKYKIKCGQKIVEDDEGEMWQDEHSGPFSWETLSQSEFCMTDDIGNTDTVKTKTRDPKRPKSPRLMRSSSTDQLTPRPGDLERSGSTDFHLLRDIWEAHHCTTPDGEMPPSLQSFLSRSQHSLNAGELNTSSTKPISASSDKVSDLPAEPPVSETPVGSHGVNLPKSPTSQKVTHFGSRVTGSSLTKKPEVTVDSGDLVATAPLATKEEDDDITRDMRDDVAKMSEIKVKMKENMSAEPMKDKPVSAEPMKDKPVSAEPMKEKPVSAEPMKEKPVSAEPMKDKPVSAEPMKEKPVSAEPMKGPTEEIDILAKFGVTFGYSAPSSQDSLDGATAGAANADSTNATDLPAGFDFLSSW